MGNYWHNLQTKIQNNDNNNNKLMQLCILMLYSNVKIYLTGLNISINPFCVAKTCWVMEKNNNNRKQFGHSTLYSQSNEHYQMFTGKPKQKYRYDKSIELYKTLLKPSHLF